MNKIAVRDLHCYYGDFLALHGLSMDIRDRQITALIGPSGCGKSTFLRCFNRMHDLQPDTKYQGAITLRPDEVNLVGPETDPIEVRMRIGMVFQKPTPFPMTIYDNIAFGVRLYERLGTGAMNERVEWALRKAALWDEVKDRLGALGSLLSGGQQQRVVIAMAMLNNPALLIMDEPTTALDVTVEAAVLDLIEDLKNDFQAANIFITHNLGVVARVSDQLCVMYAGQMVEKGPVADIFHNPSHPYTMGLLASVPRLGETKSDSILAPIRGRVPPPAERPTDECIFAPRCDYATEKCREALPGFTEVSADHLARCIYARKIDSQKRTYKKRAAVVEKEAAKPLEGIGKDLLSFDSLKVYYPQDSNSVVSLVGLGEKKFVKAVDDVSVRLAKVRTLGVVGESGCGKSTLARAIVGLIEPHR